MHSKIKIGLLLVCLLVLLGVSALADTTIVVLGTNEQQSKSTFREIVYPMAVSAAEYGDTLIAYANKNGEAATLAPDQAQEPDRFTAALKLDLSGKLDDMAGILADDVVPREGKVTLWIITDSKQDSAGGMGEKLTSLLRANPELEVMVISGNAESAKALVSDEELQPRFAVCKLDEALPVVMERSGYAAAPVLNPVNDTSYKLEVGIDQTAPDTMRQGTLLLLHATVFKPTEKKTKVIQTPMRSTDGTDVNANEYVTANPGNTGSVWIKVPTEGISEISFATVDKAANRAITPYFLLKKGYCTEIMYTQADAQPADALYRGIQYNFKVEAELTEMPKSQLKCEKLTVTSPEGEEKQIDAGETPTIIDGRYAWEFYDTFDQVGTYHVTAQIKAGEKSIVIEQDFEVFNRAPRFTAAEPWTINVTKNQPGDEMLTINHLKDAFVDDDNDPVTISTGQEPIGWSIEPIDGDLYKLTVPDDAKEGNVTVKAADDQGGEIEQNVTIKITDFNEKYSQLSFECDQSDELAPGKEINVELSEKPDSGFITWLAENGTTFAEFANDNLTVNVQKDSADATGDAKIDTTENGYVIALPASWNSCEWKISVADKGTGTELFSKTLQVINHEPELAVSGSEIGLVKVIYNDLPLIGGGEMVLIDQLPEAWQVQKTADMFVDADDSLTFGWKIEPATATDLILVPIDDDSGQLPPAVHLLGAVKATVTVAAEDHGEQAVQMQLTVEATSLLTIVIIAAAALAAVIILLCIVLHVTRPTFKQVGLRVLNSEGDTLCDFRLGGQWLDGIKLSQLAILSGSVPERSFGIELMDNIMLKPARGKKFRVLVDGAIAGLEIRNGSHAVLTVDKSKQPYGEYAIQLHGESLSFELYERQDGGK